MKCIAIDDEPLALELLTDNIIKVGFLQLAGTFSDPIEASSFLQQQSVDLVFLDIQMPGLTGLQLIKTAVKKPMFILITAYEKYALEGYELDVVDYLVKPVSLDRFIKACNKAQELYQLKSGTGTVSADRDHFFINVNYSQHRIVFNDIMYIEGLKDYVKIHLKSTGKPVIARLTFRNLEEELPPSQFVRIHKSFIVSQKYITSIKKSSVVVDDVELPVGENYKEVIGEITGRK
jgi:DNA-binding LytR/AlgR family response regulator